MAMSRKTSQASLAEFRPHVDFFRAMRKAMNTALPDAWKGALRDDAGSFDGMERMAEEMLSTGIVPAARRSGWKQATADMLEWTRDLAPDDIRRVDEFLVSTGAVSLTEMRRRVWRVIPKVLARGRIRNLNEFYVVKNVLDDDGEDLSDDERARLTEIRSAFERRPRVRLRR